MMAVQELMVDMSLEERQKFVEQLQSQLNDDEGVDPDMFYNNRQGDLMQFIKRDSKDQLPRQTIPLGPQGEDDAA